MSDQLHFDTIVHDAWRTQDAIFHAYATRHLATYYEYARTITPNLLNWRHVWDRVAFAILSANTDAQLAATALRSMRTERDQTHKPGMEIRVTGAPGITPDRLTYVRALPVGEKTAFLRRHRHETWDEYRIRLRNENHGLGITKASYAVALLYPLDADVCCLDVWMQRVLYRDREHDFAWLSDDQYRALEARVRGVANTLAICTALAQWIMWDFIRTGFPTSQDYFAY